jgi:hypothetical protein
MKQTQTTMKITKTALENQVLEIISHGDDYEGVPTQCFLDIMDEFTGTKSELKGVLGSLFKKELISEGEYPNGMNAYHLNSF